MQRKLAPTFALWTDSCIVTAHNLCATVFEHLWNWYTNRIKIHWRVSSFIRRACSSIYRLEDLHCASFWFIQHNLIPLSSSVQLSPRCFILLILWWEQIVAAESGVSSKSAARISLHPFTHLRRAATRLNKDCVCSHDYLYACTR